MRLKTNIAILSVFMMGLSLLSSCGFYSFSGTSIDPKVETFSVSFFENNASIVSPLLSQTITENLKQKFISETNLSIVENDGDFSFSGVITGFSVAPVSAQSTDDASLNRLTIMVDVKLVPILNEGHLLLNQFRTLGWVGVFVFIRLTELVKQQFGVLERY